MNKKGFTLIELLAVIVILAIIALIAAPIILGIINDSREQSKHRTAELIAKEVELAYTSYLFKNNGQGDPNNFCSYMTKDHFTMDNAEIVTEGEYASNCATDKKVTIKRGNDYYTIAYNSGTAKVLYGEDEYTKVTLDGTSSKSDPIIYYSSSYGNIKDNLPDDATTNILEQYVYLKLESEDGKTVSAASVCFEKEGTTYCLKGGDPSKYSENKKILIDLFGSSCSDKNDFYSCSRVGGFESLIIKSDGYVQVVRSSLSCLADNESYVCSYLPV